MKDLIFKLFYPAFRYDANINIDKLYWPLLSVLLIVSLGLLLIFPINVHSATSGLIYGVYASLMRVILFLLYGFRQISDEEMEYRIGDGDKRRSLLVWVIIWMASISLFETVNILLFGFVFITIFCASNLVQLIPTRKKKKSLISRISSRFSINKKK